MESPTHQTAACRLARLAAHLGSPREVSSSGLGDELQRHGTAASASGGGGAPAGGGEQQSFEPGRLLLGQTAIVTGGGSGIGRAVSFECSSRRTACWLCTAAGTMQPTQNRHTAAPLPSASCLPPRRRSSLLTTAPVWSSATWMQQQHRQPSTSSPTAAAPQSACLATSPTQPCRCGWWRLL